MLQRFQSFNDFSDKFRDELEKKARSLGKRVKFKFDISKPNPDPQKYNGDKVYPGMYTLDPRTFRITDPYEDRKGVSKSKEVGLVDKIDRDGKPESFHRIRIFEREKGIKEFIVIDDDGREDYEALEFVMFLLLHPKLKDGKFQDRQKPNIVELIDEKANARASSDLRKAKTKALTVASKMDEQQARQFADAMMWDRNEDFEVLVNRIEEFAESTPDLFNKLVDGKDLEYQALVKRALDKRVISFDPAEYKFIWTANQQPIAILNPTGDKNEVEKLSEWLQVDGQKEKEVYKKIKGLVSEN